MERAQKDLGSAADKGAATYEIARIWATGQQWPEALDWLKRITNLGFDPSRDSVFAPLKGTREFEAIMAQVRNATPPVLHSRLAFKVAEADLVPESMAYDPRGRQFYFGSEHKGKVLRCTMQGDCKMFAEGLGEVLGLKVRDGSLWLVSNSDERAALIEFDLESGKKTEEFPVPGSGHRFNDLTLGATGDIFVTDTPAGAVWHLANHSIELVRLPQAFPFANGVALSPETTLLYVSTFPDGLALLDLKTHTATPIARPEGLSLALIDGLYFYRNSLIAVQNGFMNPRVVRLRLSRDLRAVTGSEVLERRNPLFDGVTTGTLVGREFFYMANIQDDKRSGFNPIAILRVRL